MDVVLTRQTKPYPRYLYHRDFDEPKIVNSKAEEMELGTKGWIVSYIHKDYPKWVGDKIVRSKEEEERLLASQQSGSAEVSPLADEAFNMFGAENVKPEEPTVTKETRIDNVDPTVVKKPKEGNGRRKKNK